MAFKEIGDAAKLEAVLRAIKGVTAATVDAPSKRAKVTIEDVSVDCDAVLFPLRKDGIECHSVDPIHVVIRVAGPEGEADWKAVTAALSGELGVSCVKTLGDNRSASLHVTASLVDLAALKKAVARAGGSKKFESEIVSHDEFQAPAKAAEALRATFGVAQVRVEGDQAIALYEKEFVKADRLREVAADATK